MNEDIHLRQELHAFKYDFKYASRQSLLKRLSIPQESKSSIPETLKSGHKELNGSNKQTRKSRTTMTSQSYINPLFLLQLQVRKIHKGFNSLSSPNESENLGCVIKLHIVVRHSEEKKKRASSFEIIPWEFPKERLVLITHFANQVQPMISF